jgi:hypothetical protein
LLAFLIDSTWIVAAGGALSAVIAGIGKLILDLRKQGGAVAQAVGANGGQTTAREMQDVLAQRIDHSHERLDHVERTIADLAATVTAVATAVETLRKPPT